MPARESDNGKGCVGAAAQRGLHGRPDLVSQGAPNVSHAGLQVNQPPVAEGRHVNHRNVEVRRGQQHAPMRALAVQRVRGVCKEVKRNAGVPNTRLADRFSKIVLVGDGGAHRGVAAVQMGPD